MRRLAFILCFIFFAVTALGVPVPVKKVGLVKGEVAGAIWLSGFKVNIEDPDSLLKKTGLPDRYSLLLKNHNLDDKTANELSAHSQIAELVKISYGGEIPKGHIVVFVRSKELKKLKVGAKIELKGVSMGGDEFGYWVNHEEFSLE